MGFWIEKWGLSQGKHQNGDFHIKNVPQNIINLTQPLNLPRFEISKCKHSSKHWSYHKIAFNSQKAKIWAKVKSFDQFHEN